MIALTNSTIEKPAEITEATKQPEEKKETENENEEKIGNEVLENGNSEDDHKDQPATTGATSLGTATLQASDKANIQNANDHNADHDPDYHHDMDVDEAQGYGDESDPTH